MRPSDRCIRELAQYAPCEAGDFFSLVTKEFEREFIFQPNTPQKVIDAYYTNYWKGAHMMKDKIERRQKILLPRD